MWQYEILKCCSSVLQDTYLIAHLTTLPGFCASHSTYLYRTALIIVYKSASVAMSGLNAEHYFTLWPYRYHDKVFWIEAYSKYHRCIHYQNMCFKL